MSQPKVLVVGGAGYVGANTCKALQSAGYIPVVFDNLSTGHHDFVRWGHLVVGDIRDSTAVRDAINAHQIEAVLHFAACAYVGESVTDPQKYYDNNVTGTLSLLRGMLDANCRQLVFSSTCAIYGQPENVPISEGTPSNPVNPYGASKLMVERILSDYRRAYDVRSIALRYFNASGADLNGEIGELRDPETHLIPRAMMAIQGYIDDFQVFGADFPTEDGTAVRDYIHVADLATAHVSGVSRLMAGLAGGAFNLGTEVGYSVKAVLEAIELETGAKLPAANGARREGDPAVLVADATQARDVLGFVPRHSDLQTIVRTAWAWHKHAHPRLKRSAEAGN
jgi:UDP-glucose-4-epimerase GalE